MVYGPVEDTYPLRAIGRKSSACLGTEQQ